jgi:hypothetical protein
MIDGFIRATLGPVGVTVLDFYIANSLWINGLVLLYGLLVVLARRSFELSRQSLINSLQNQYGPRFEQRKPEAVLRILKKLSIPWKDALVSSSFPFITPPGSIRIFPKRLATLQKLLPLETLAQFLIKP